MELCNLRKLEEIEGRDDLVGLLVVRLEVCMFCKLSRIL